MIEIYVDGACSGNPGKTGVGYLIYKDGKTLKKGSVALGVQTNNFAEYMALIFSLVDAMSLGETNCKVYSDSQLLCEQIKGNYKVKNNNIVSLFILAKTIISKFNRFEIEHVRREKNQEADKLAKKAVGFLE
ncbi:MAG: ribonuclease HI family protein [Candidatus Omnitrophica bacterium]|nr:ribonuclease HI family protein [Candidatus Omnitrophota bacterium]